MMQPTISDGRKARDGGQKRGWLFVVSGPSGSGKTSLAERVLEEKSIKLKVKKNVSYTTRPKRSLEKSKRDYFFVGDKEFIQGIKEKKFLEWTRYLGYYYGTLKETVDKQLSNGKYVLLCVDLKGAMRLKRLYPKNITTVFIMPPSILELEQRIRKRCSKSTEEEITKRVKLAKKEILAADKFDYCLVNKDLEKTAEQFKRIILDRIKRQLKN